MPRGNLTGFNIAVKECRKWKDLPSRTLARKLLKEYYPVWTTFDSVMNCVRHIRGVRGKRKCPKTKDLHKNAQYNYIDHCPPSAPGRQWIPAIIDGSRMLNISDPHIPYHDVSAVNVVVSDACKLGINSIFINGDLIDSYQVSRFVRDPRKRDFCEDIKTTQEFLGYLRRKFPKAEISWKFGNHDLFFEQYMFTHAPELIGLPGMELEKIVDTDKYGVRVIKDNRVCMLGKLSALHGHETGFGSIGPVNPARGIFLKTLEPVIIGHYHRTSQHAEGTLRGKLITCWSTGCLCGLHPEYMRVNKWNHGYAFIEIDKNGEYNVTNKRIFKGKSW